MSKPLRKSMGNISRVLLNVCFCLNKARSVHISFAWKFEELQILTLTPTSKCDNADVKQRSREF